MDVTGRAWDDALRMGRGNREIIELARRHCLDMQFVRDGDGALAEAQTGLPIDPRQIQCPVAIGGEASNLSLIIGEFYREHCVGCPRRRATGEVPNLATVIEDGKAEAARQAALRETELARARTGWAARVERRRAVAASGGEAMADAVRNIGLVDPEPGAEVNPSGEDAARDRLSALADRAPQVFTDEVVALGLDLVVEAGVAEQVLEPLRRLTRTRPEFAPALVRAALVALRRGPALAAGRCIADFKHLLAAEDLDEQVCRSLVLLAGAPYRDRRYHYRYRPSRTTDPTGLRAAADVAPATLSAVLQRMLPAPSAPVGLILPGPPPPPSTVTAPERAAAAGSVTALATTHPALAAALVRPLILDLAVPPDDYHDDPAVPAIRRALTVMLVLDVGDVAAAAEQAGRTGSAELRETLFDVFPRTADLLDADMRHREPGDPLPEAARRDELLAMLFSVAVERLGGDWGDEVRVDASQLVARMARLAPQRMLDNLPTLLGVLLRLVDDLQPPPPPVLDVMSAEPPTLRALTLITRGTTISSAASRVLDAVEAAAAVDPLFTVATITVLITEQRDTARGPEVVWRLLRSLGQIGRRHGGQPRVLQAILPTLHSYLVDADVALRAEAIDQWAEVGSVHTLPSSLTDLLPALLTDRYVAVIQAVLGAARRLSWSDDARPRLLGYAVLVLQAADQSTNAKTIRAAVAAATRLAREDEPVLAAVERFVLDRAALLDGYDLRDVLRRTWLASSTGTLPMARLRLRQAEDPRINNRFNGIGDNELCDLLACGPGLRNLPTKDLTRAALRAAPQYPWLSAEFAEVAWRAGRPADASTVMRAVAATIPDQPAFAWQIRFTQLMITAAAADAAAVAGQDWSAEADRATSAAAALATECKDEQSNDEDSSDDSLRDLLTATTTTLELRRLLRGEFGSRGGGDGPAGGRLGNPAEGIRKQAQALRQSGTTLAAVAHHVTATCEYLRAVAGLCEVAAHLLLGEAAVLDADTAAMTAHTTAARRRADLIAADLTARFDPDDPLAGPLVTHLHAVSGLPVGAPAGPVLTEWARLPLPVPVVRGPRRSTRPPTVAVQDDGGGDHGAPIAVILASVDGQLITGPEVLAPNTVHELTLEVQAGPWPDWAERLDAELLTHLAPADITTPAFTWRRGDHTGDGETYVQSGPLVLRFALPAGRPAPPFLMRLAWRGRRDGSDLTQALDPTGHRELRLRPFDATRDMLTDYPVFDERLLALYERLARAGYDPGQLQAFCRLLTAICRVGLRMTWDKEYRRGSRVTERTFHDDLYERLLGEPELQSRLERGSPSALGYLDVRHDGITAELKVERKTPVTRDTAPRYLGQPTQYAAADGARLSILAILDMSPKILPIGTPENYLFDLKPRLHGLENPEAPSLVTTIIVNANMPTPSSWSRRRTPTAGPIPPDPIEDPRGRSVSPADAET